MDTINQVVDYLMDFHKVRKFQEFCGLVEDKRNNDNFAQSSSFPENRKTKNDNQALLRYKVRNRFIHGLFLFGSVLGTEVFYITCIPFLLWNIDEYIARKVVVVWVVTMYIGQAIKDIIKWPRPTSPPVFKLEKRVAAEYGMPSTHAIAGTSIPFAVFLTSICRYNYPYVIGFILATLWSLLVSSSRLYVGMHSIMDILGGILISFLYLFFGHPFMEVVDEYTLHSTYAPYIIILSHYLLALFYPNTEPGSTTRADTAVILGVGAGYLSGSWINQRYGLQIIKGDIILPAMVTVPSLFVVLVSLSRFIVGMVCVLLIKTIAKWLAVNIVSHLISEDKFDSDKKVVPIKFLTYSSVGVGAVCIAPIFINFLGLNF